ncbi:hypothetical protein BpHYR1_000618 [Brachionus plicatilis]|uniref:Uncharacterized protein n=1 Tax=Brachionus plicatilis TaxID=10195 RepID=A0A3M7R5S1_BRAPC|nr:hypothetical protein BpHYR1_000618 [Brachionus plicatilis]
MRKLFNALSFIQTYSGTGTCTVSPTLNSPYLYSFQIQVQKDKGKLTHILKRNFIEKFVRMSSNKKKTNVFLLWLIPFISFDNRI